MLFKLGKYLFLHFESLSFLRLVNYISFRSIMAALTATIFLFCFSRPFIIFMHRRSFLDQVRETGISSAFDKKGTPTMGGILIIGAIITSLLLWGDWSNRFLVFVMISLVGFGLIGFWDDVVKSRHRSGDKGISESLKFFLEGIVALAFAIAYLSPLSPLPSSMSSLLYVPFIKHPIADLGYLYIPFIVFFIILVANAVNITDGLDGLAITPSIFVMAVLGVFAYVEGNVIYSAYLNYPYLRGAGELTVFGAAFVGAGLGFLWYNSYPAQIFMGDTGSLAIGGTLASICVLLKQEMLFPILGGLFLAEAFTSQIQDKIGVRWLGRRIFYRAPLHHDLQYQGIAETKVVIRLWIVSGILALIALATIKLR